MSASKSNDKTNSSQPEGAAAGDDCAAGPFSPSGLRVLVVDDDPMCLKVVSSMLQRCTYQVATCSSGRDALDLLKHKQDEGSPQFDLILSDVYMPDMDGFRLLEQIGLELDLPVIMMSSNGDTSVVLRGVTHGAVDFLIKPVRIEELRNVWQHVVRRRSLVIGRPSDDYAEASDNGEPRHGMKRKESEAMVQSGGEGPGTSSGGGGSKKARVIWSVEMHQQFVEAVNQLGVDKAVPKRILELMRVEGLTRENVASHLQKYRLYLRRVQGASPSAMAAARGGGSACSAGEPESSGAQPGAKATAAAAATTAATPKAPGSAGVSQQVPSAVSLAGNPGMAAAAVAAAAAAAWQHQALALHAAVAAAAAGAPPGSSAGMPLFPPPGMMPPVASATSAGVPAFPAHPVAEQPGMPGMQSFPRYPGMPPPQYPSGPLHEGLYAASQPAPRHTPPAPGVLEGSMGSGAEAASCAFPPGLVGITGPLAPPGGPPPAPGALLGALSDDLLAHEALVGGHDPGGLLPHLKTEAPSMSDDFIGMLLGPD